MQPLLATAIESWDDVKLPVFASPKLDGIRCLTDVIKAKTRSWKEVPNVYAQDKMSAFGLHRFDGELIVGDPTDPHCYNHTSSGIMSRGGTPDFTLWVFDTWGTDPSMPFHYRLEVIRTFILAHQNPRLKLLEQRWIDNLAELQAYEAQKVAEGFEGIMIRDPEGVYKYGRSTVKEGILNKVKRFVDSEATVVGYKEGLTNANEATEDAFGRTERSSHKDNMVPRDTLGALILKHSDFEDTFDCGSGFDDVQRAEAWAERFGNLIGRTATFKYQASGMKDKPRFPIFKGWRYD